VARVLIIDDERGIRLLCRDVLSRAGHSVEVAETGEAGMELALGGDFDLIFSDINLPGASGLVVLERILAAKPDTTVVLITAYPSVETAVTGMKLGARDYLTKPFGPDELRMVARRALSEDALVRENRQLRRELAGALIGESAPMRRLRETIAKVAGADATVLVRGESGTGKELVARAIHYEGPRAAGRFVAVSCGALVATLLESELFGHVRGAFTGADSDKTGLFVAASGGTLLLDEIGEMPLDLQPKLLRALQERAVKPIGALDPVRADTRVVAATNRDLRAEVAGGGFREDLFYRLDVITIEVPPLRDRRDDIPMLARHFAERAAIRSGQAPPTLTDAAIDKLVERPWPGNVRELENAIERAVVLAPGPEIGPGDLADRPGLAAASSGEDDGDELLSLEELERRHVFKVLEACGGQKTRAAAVLGINRTTLWKKLRNYGVE
jgi:DNA-binding NtrC family response regulator